MIDELKIVVGNYAHNTKVFVNDKPVGLIQKLKFSVDVNSKVSDIEITFYAPETIPNVNNDFETGINRSWSITKEYTLNAIAMFNNLPHVKLIYQDFSQP